MNQPVFVLTSGRSGSQMLGEVLNLDPRIHARHEPLPNLIRHHYRVWRGFMDSRKVNEMLAWARDSEIKKVQDSGEIYFESSHFMSFFVKELKERYNAKFIHLIRDGKGFVTSGMNRNWYLDSPWKNAVRSFLFARLNIMDFHFVQRLNFPSELLRLQPPEEASTPVEKAAWLWQEHNLRIAKQLKEQNAEYIEVRLEQFKENPEAALSSILDFLGADGTQVMPQMLELCQSRPNKTPQALDHFPKVQHWDDRQHQSFDRFARHAQAYFNYSS